MKIKCSPWLAAVLNFFFWGLGYLYVRKVFLGLCFMASVLIILAASGIVVEDPARAVSLMFFAWILLGTGLARDAYRIAKEKAEVKKNG